MSVSAGMNLSMLLDRWPDGDPSGRDVITAARRFARRISSRLDESLEGLGLSYAQYEVMEHLAARPNLHAGELGRRLRITRQSAHALLHQLARADLVELLQPDGGARPAHLTPTGRHRLERCRQAVASVEMNLEDVDAGTRRTFLTATADLDVRMAPSPRETWWFS